MGTMNQFVTACRQRMEQKNVSMTELADLSGVARTYLYRVFDRSQTPSIEVCSKLASALDLELKTVRARKKPTPEKTA